MKLVIGNSNNPYMAENCTLKPVLNQQIHIKRVDPKKFEAQAACD